MQTKHTPGPWHLLLTHGAAFEIGDHSDLNKANILCTRYEWEERAGEMLANGRLMAAAPDLLEALQAILPDAVGNHIGGPDTQARIDAARAAITKATRGAK
jgi:hypothetical protein